MSSDSGPQNATPGELPEVEVLRQLVAVRGRALLDAFGAHAIDIGSLGGTSRLILYLDEPGPDPRLALPTMLTVTNDGAGRFDVMCVAAESDQASFDH